MAAPLDHDRNVLVSERRAEMAPGDDPPQGGSPFAVPTFEQLYEQRFDDVSRWVRALGVREADRDDVVQDVFVVVHRRLPDFDGQNVTGWLYQIARRKVRDHRHLTWVKHLFGVHRVPVVESILSGQQGPLDGLETKQKAELLERLLDTLNDDQRAAFVLFEIEGSSGERIAELQGVPINTVWARIHKARKKLQEGAARAQKKSSRRGEP
jgi:RNA polymerase sigma-70 factor (ECF subfamily)